jgi:hypothetical protein
MSRYIHISEEYYGSEGVLFLVSIHSPELDLLCTPLLWSPCRSVRLLSRRSRRHARGKMSGSGGPPSRGAPERSASGDRPSGGALWMSGCSRRVEESYIGAWRARRRTTSWGARPRAEEHCGPVAEDLEDEHDKLRCVAQWADDPVPRSMWWRRGGAWICSKMIANLFSILCHHFLSPLCNTYDHILSSISVYYHIMLSMCKWFLYTYTG